MQNSVPNSPPPKKKNYIIRIVLFSFLNGHNQLSQHGRTTMFRCSYKKKWHYVTKYSVADTQRKNMSILHCEDSLHLTVSYSLFISESVKRSVRGNLNNWR